MESVTAFSTSLAFPSLLEAQSSLAGIAELQGFKINQWKGPSHVPGATTPTVAVYDGVACFKCNNHSTGCKWFVSVVRVALEPLEQWRIYTANDVHCGICRPARRKARQASISSVESFETDASELGIPRESREAFYVRSPSLAVPELQKTTAPSSLQLLPAIPPTSAEQPTPELTPATTHSSAQEPKSPTPSDANAVPSYLEELMRSLDMPTDENGDLANMDPADMLAAVNQPMDLSQLLGVATSTSSSTVTASAVPEWRKGATGAHEFLSGMSQQERDRLQPRLERAVSVVQNMTGLFADASGAQERARSPSPWSLYIAVHGFSPVPVAQEEQTEGLSALALNRQADMEAEQEQEGMQYIVDQQEQGLQDERENEEEEDHSSDDDIPAEELINNSRSTQSSQSRGTFIADPLHNGTFGAPSMMQPALPSFSARQASAEKYISPMNLLSPSKDQDWHYEPFQQDYAPIASTSALPSPGFSAEEATPIPAEPAEAEEKEDEESIDIYQIFSSYKEAETALMTNAKNFSLPLEVKWKPGTRHARGACLQCVRGCGYEIHLGDDSLGNWRMVSIDGEHAETCHPQYSRRGGMRTKKSKKGSSGLGTAGNKPKQLNNKKKPTSASTAYNMNKKKNNKGKGRAVSPLLQSDAEEEEQPRRALSPISSFPRRRRGEDSEASSSPGVVVQSSWKPQHSSPKRKNMESSSSISPQKKKKRISDAGSTADKPIDLDLESEDEQGDQAQMDDDDDDIMLLPPPLRSSPPTSTAPPPATSSPMDPTSSYARKKLPEYKSPKHSIPTKPFGRRRHKIREKRVYHAIIEEPIFVEARKKDLPRDLGDEGLNGGYWNRLDDAGNRVDSATGSARKEKGKGRARREESSGDDYDGIEEIRQDSRTTRATRSRAMPSSPAGAAAPALRARPKRKSLPITQLSPDIYNDNLQEQRYDDMEIEEEAPEPIRPIPTQLKTNMSLSEAGFSKSLCHLLTKAGFSTAGHLTKEGLEYSMEDFVNFREALINEKLEKNAVLSKEDLRWYVRELVTQVRARALLAWEHDGMKGDEDEEEDEEEQEEQERQDESESEASV